MASRMLVDQPGLALLVFGGVFLAVTGGEALYADMGHFGKKADPPGLALRGVSRPGAELSRPGRLHHCPPAGTWKIRSS